MSFKSVFHKAMKDDLIAVYFSFRENEPVFNFSCSVLNKGTTGTIFYRLWYDAVLDWELNPRSPAL